MANTPRKARLIDLRIPLRRGLQFRLVERPGLGLAGRDLHRLVEDLRSVADHCVPHGRLRYGVLSGDQMRLEQSVIAVIYDRDTGRAMGFNAMSTLEIDLGGRTVNVLHAGLCMVDPTCRSRGLTFLMSAAPPILALFRNRLRPLWVTNVTQVPAAAGVFAEGAEAVYPAPGHDVAPSESHSEVASQLMARHRGVFGVGADATFDAQAFVIQNSYTGGSEGLKKTLDQCRKHRDPRVNDLCTARLDYQRGDDLLQVGRVTPRLCVRLAGRLMRGIRIPSPFRGRIHIRFTSHTRSRFRGRMIGIRREGVTR